MRPKQSFAILCIGGLLSWQPASFAADQKKTSSPAADGSSETIAKPMTEKEKKKREAKLRKELETPYKRWLTEDVGYIITDEERKAFKQLATDDERQNFIEQFWFRRDPTPDTEENEFKEEHYRRIAYANERFASGIPGWKTDRGRIYIVYGPPDEIDAHPSGGSYERPVEEGGGETSTYPFEQWRYRYIEGIGNDIVIEFVDPTMSGEYHMTMDPSEKDALLYVPNAGLTMYEQMGMSSKNDRFNRTDGTHLGTGNMPLPASMDEFERLSRFANLQKAPPVKFKDLEAAITSTIRFNTLPMQVHVDYVPVTGSSTLTPITLQFDRRDLNFSEKDGISKATINIFGRVTSMSRKPVSTFEDVVTAETPKEMLQEMVKGKSIYQKNISLAPGRYRLNVVAKDVTGGNICNYETALTVPRLEDDKLMASSLIVADELEKVPTKSIGMGQFVIGTSKIRPRVGESFSKDEKLGIYLQVYNFQMDEKTQRPNGQLNYEIIKNDTNQKVFEFSEDASGLGGSGSQLIIEKILPLRSLEPGQYTINVKAVDKNRSQSVVSSANFSVH